MDILCPKCTEPWDRFNFNILQNPCDSCEGRKVFPRKHPELTEKAGEASILLIDQDIQPDQCDKGCNRGKINCEPCKGKGYVHLNTIPREDSGEDLGIYTRDEEPEIVDCTHCDGDGYYDCECNGESIWPECCECNEKIEGDGRYRDIAVRTEGGDVCEDCAKKEELLSYEEECSDCNGTGINEIGEDALEPDEIRRFLKGEGCPACRFGTSLECWFCNGKGASDDGKTYCHCSDCGGNGRIPLDKLPPDTEYEERREKASALFEIYAPHSPDADLDGLAADTEDLIGH